MDLGDRGSGKRNRVEAAEDLLERHPELGLDGRLGLPGTERRHLVLETGKLGNDLRGQDVSPEAERLAELDERGAEIPEGEPQALRGGQRACAVPPPSPREQHPAPERQVGRQAQAADHVHETVPDEDRYDLAETAELPARRPGDRSHVGG